MLAHIKPQYRIYFLQFALAGSLGALLARLPDLQVKFALTESQVGLLLITMSSGVLCGLTLLGRLVDRLPARTTAMATVFGASSLYALVPFMPTAPAAVPLLFLAGTMLGSLEILTNVQADRLEAVLGRRIMSRVHGMWSLGFFLTALVAAGLRQAGVPVEVHMCLVVLVVVTSGILVFRNIKSAPRRLDDHTGATPRFAFPTLALLPLCLLGAAPLFLEGAGVDWSVIYMRDVFSVAPLIGGLSVTLFSLAIAIGRLSMDPVVDRYGPRAVATALLVLAGSGAVMVAAAPDPATALVGFGLAGLGCSSVYPLAISAAARRTDRPASVNVAALGQITFVVFFAGPPLLGFIAEHIGIRFSYWAVVPFLALALLPARRLAARIPTGPIAAD